MGWTYQNKIQCPVLPRVSWILRVWILKICTYLGLQERKKTTTEKSLSVKRRSQMVGVVTTGWDIGHPKKRTKGVLAIVSELAQKAF